MILMNNRGLVYQFNNDDENTKLLEIINKYRLDGAFCDFTVRAGEKAYKCHQVIVAAKSSYFQTMLSSSFQESSKGEVDFSNNSSIDQNQLGVVMEYLYLGSITITPGNLTGILETATYLGIDCLVEACVAACTDGLITTENVIDILVKSIGLNPSIANLCHDFINGHLPEVCETEEFLNTEYDVLLDIVTSEKQEANEECVWEAVIRWVRHEEEGRRELLPQLMEHVRLDLMTSRYLCQTIAEESLVKSCVKCKDQLYDLFVERVLEDPIGDIPKHRFYNGHIHVLGGEIPMSIPRRDVLKYQPYSNAWASVGVLPVGLTQFGAAVVDNSLYTLGGITPSGHKSCIRRYDLCKEEWANSACANTIKCNFGTCAADQHIYMCGGESDAEYFKWRSVERYRPHLDYCEAVTPLNVVRVNPGVVYLQGSVWATGGQSYSKQIVKTVERFDPRIGYWKNCAPMLTPRYRHGAVVLNDKIYVCGGADNSSLASDSVEEYDPRNDKWRMLSKMGCKRDRFSLVVYNHTLWAVGGCGQGTVEVYNPRADKWCFSTPLGVGVYDHAAVVVPSVRDA